MIGGDVMDQEPQGAERTELDVVQRDLAILSDQLQGFLGEVDRLGLRDLSMMAGGLATLCVSVSVLAQILRNEVVHIDAVRGSRAALSSGDQASLHL